MRRTGSTLTRRGRRPRTTRTHEEFIAWMRDECDKQLAAEPPDPEDIESPTGRKPRLVWTPALQRTYNRMLSEHEAGEDTLGAIWCDLIFDNARGNVYGDYGLWATIAYQMTGDVEFVEIAWRKLEPVLASSFGDDNTNREYSAERVLTLDWLWPGLTEAQRAEYLAALDRMCASMVDPAIRMNDSDQATGSYFGLAFYSLAFGDLHPPAAQWLARPDIGGLDATARDRTTLRNAILDYVEMAAGGEWIESQEYNLGTVRLLLIGAAGVQTATGVDHFPEVTTWVPAAALKYPLMTTPDLSASFQWGDEQHPHTFEPWRWVCTAMCVNHPVARAYVYDLVAQYGPVGYNTAEATNPKAFLLFDPYGQRSTNVPTLFDARGQGILAARSAV